VGRGLTNPLLEDVVITTLSIMLK